MAMAKAKAKTKTILDGHLYVIEAAEDEDGAYKVYKLNGDMSARPAPYVVGRDLSCTCPAGEHGNECKHTRMVDRTLLGKELTHAAASGLVDEYCAKLLSQWPDSQWRSLLTLMPPEEPVDVAHVLVLGALNETHKDRLTIWTEFGPLLMVLHVFNSERRYEAAWAKAQDHATRKRRPRRR